MKPVKLSALAFDDLNAASEWYRAQAADVGERFLDFVNETITAVSENPLRFTTVYQDIRRALLPPFPFGIFYRIQPDRVQVIAIVHLHRDPASWMTRGT
jgi:toxin ParE1/3/4